MEFIGPSADQWVSGCADVLLRAAIGRALIDHLHASLTRLGLKAPWKRLFH